MLSPGNIWWQFKAWFILYIGKFVLNSRTFQRLLKDLPAVFKDYKIMKNIDLHKVFLLQEF